MPVDDTSAGPLWAVMYHSVADPTDDPYQVTVSRPGSPGSSTGCAAGA